MLPLKQNLAVIKGLRELSLSSKVAGHLYNLTHLETYKVAGWFYCNGRIPIKTMLELVCVHVCWGYYWRRQGMSWVLKYKVFYWFSPLLREAYLWILSAGFPLSSKTSISSKKFQFDQKWRRTSPYDVEQEWTVRLSSLY